MSEAACHDDAPAPVARAGRVQVVLAGNPNVGKTTLFNKLTGSMAKVSNYPGITVDRRAGTLPLPGGDADLHDLPGTYSLNARSAEEQIAFDAIAGLADQPPPDVVVACLDATQLARSAYLLLQCQELGARCVVALTMFDEAGAAAPDPAALADALGCEVIPVIASTSFGLPELREAIGRASAAARKPVWRWQPTAALRAHLDAIVPALPAAWRSSHGHDDALALWALTCIDSSPDGDELANIAPALRSAVETRKAGGGDDDASVLARWRWLDEHVAELPKARPDRSRTERIDRVLLHRVIGFGVFMAVMAIMFMSLFWWAAPVMDGIDHGFKALGGLVRELLGAGMFTDFLVDGVIGGVGSVLVFLPQILLLFLFLGFLEDCGYLARVAYLMDRIMRTMNLHGRAFVPMLSGFACAIPAIMATRTMERRRDRILTMMVVPLMTCSARLPVYTLIIGALIPGSHFTQGLLMVGMYLFSVCTALTAAWVLSKTIKPLRAKQVPFLIELPPYRFPRIADVLRMMWGKASMFLREAGTVILGCSIALWALLYFPRELPKGSPDYDALVEKAPSDDARVDLEAQRAAAHLESSFGGRLGHAIEPVIKPLGFDWKIGVGLVGAFAAREVFISTLGIVYAVGGDADESSAPLRAKLHEAQRRDGSRAYTPLVGLSLLIFFALACQCMSTLAIVRRETRSMRWPAFLFAYMTVLAWVVSFLVYQGGKLLGFS
jgi:ferrous iron transport protein B